MRSPQLESMLAESGLAAEAADELRAALAPLQQPDTSAPAPSEALAALFPQGESASAPVGTVTPIRARGRRAVSGALVLALASVGATGLSAAANTLPTPWQHQVSEFAHRYLPFDLPEPRLGPPRERAPLSGAGTPRTTAGTLVPSRPHARQAPRDDAPSTTVVVPRGRLAKAAVADATVARTPRSAQVTTTRSSTRWEHSVAWSAPAPAPTSCAHFCADEERGDEVHRPQEVLGLGSGRQQGPGQGPGQGRRQGHRLQERQPAGPR